MSIKEELLHSMGATEEDYNPGDYIFRESGSPQFYYQVVKGDVKLNNYNTDGKEFIQNILTNEDAVGESMLFTEKPYPINAIALTKCTIMKVCKTTLFSYLALHPDIYIEVCKSLSERLYRKFVLMQKISSHNAAERLKEVIEMMKKEQENQERYTFEVPLTRQQLASLTGLCIETTIRTIKKMERDKILHIKNRKIMF
ncbi:Crp/Fnr family transcriptional regulator [Chryseobacterium chendengshani]|uniref:Crp/Fnr family transcriptional regulator n=1 Tax=Chryseobacterium sp. LJ668 TaxID=2864040 RepID=UPI001C692C13|nr:Crp/Fnr family transcriptional regulator [Chryseobacterium sp. LJ668]MBW8522146.1 Crp/Fnr family transcriptional regulator [Chryseobacterium sp. LJ668]QYK17793.1 Crp/Fnr family transcriptional regulator [Chryseobacterium sp. LJ668]